MAFDFRSSGGSGGVGGLNSAQANTLIEQAENSRTILRANSTTGVEPTSAEWPAPTANDVAEVILDNGTKEYFRFGAPWTLEITIPAGAVGSTYAVNVNSTGSASAVAYPSIVGPNTPIVIEAPTGHMITSTNVGNLVNGLVRIPSISANTNVDVVVAPVAAETAAGDSLFHITRPDDTVPTSAQITAQITAENGGVAPDRAEGNDVTVTLDNGDFLIFDLEADLATWTQRSRINAEQSYALTVNVSVGSSLTAAQLFFPATVSAQTPFTISVPAGHEINSASLGEITNSGEVYFPNGINAATTVTIGSIASTTTTGVVDFDDDVANVAALVPGIIPAGQQDYRAKVGTNQIVYRTIDGGSNWDPVSRQVEVDDIAGLAALSEQVENQTARQLDTQTTWKWNGLSWEEIAGGGGFATAASDTAAGSVQLTQVTELDTAAIPEDGSAGPLVARANQLAVYSNADNTEYAFRGKALTPIVNFDAADFTVNRVLNADSGLEDVKDFLSSLASELNAKGFIGGTFTET